MVKINKKLFMKLFSLCLIPYQLQTSKEISKGKKLVVVK